MTVLSLSRLASRAIWRNRLRSFLTVLGVVIGVGAVVAIVGIGEGASSAVQDQIASLGDNVIMVFQAHSRRGGITTSGQGGLRLSLEDGEALESDCPSIEMVSSMVHLGVQLVRGGANWPTQAQGVNSSYFKIRSYELENGRFFTKSENRTGAKVCLIGKTVADELFPQEDPIGASIRVRNIPFKVIGMWQPKGQTSWGQDQDDSILLPLRTAHLRLLGNDRINMIVISARDGSAVESATEEIATLLRARHKLGANSEDDFMIRTQSEIAGTMDSITGVMTALLGSIAAVSLLVGGIGIMNIMLVSVTERTREIGIRMAVGAKGRHILLQFLVEAIVLSLFGGWIGISVGYGICWIVEKIAGWNTLITSNTIFLSLGFALFVGVFFGFYPARKAARLDPIQALHYE